MNAHGEDIDNAAGAVRSLRAESKGGDDLWLVEAPNWATAFSKNIMTKTRSLPVSPVAAFVTEVCLTIDGGFAAKQNHSCIK
jgi:hypothetical protein